MLEYPLRTSSTAVGISSNSLSFITLFTFISTPYRLSSLLRSTLVSVNPAKRSIESTWFIINSLKQLSTSLHNSHK